MGTNIRVCTEKAALYRETARQIAEGECSESATCLAIEVVQGRKIFQMDDWSSATKAYRETMLPENVCSTWSVRDSFESGSWVLDPEEEAEIKNVRLLMLCFMAAITERP